MEQKPNRILSISQVQLDQLIQLEKKPLASLLKESRVAAREIMAELAPALTDSPPKAYYEWTEVVEFVRIARKEIELLRKQRVRWEDDQ